MDAIGEFDQNLKVGHGAHVYPNKDQWNGVWVMVSLSLPFNHSHSLSQSLSQSLSRSLTNGMVLIEREGGRKVDREGGREGG